MPLMETGVRNVVTDRERKRVGWQKVVVSFQCQLQFRAKEEDALSTTCNRHDNTYLEDSDVSLSDRLLQRKYHGNDVTLVPRKVQSRLLQTET